MAASMGIEDKRKAAMCVLHSDLECPNLSSTSITTVPSQQHAPSGRNCCACRVPEPQAAEACKELVVEVHHGVFS